MAGHYSFFVEYEVGDWVQYKVWDGFDWGEITAFRITYRSEEPEGESEYLVGGHWRTINEFVSYRRKIEMQPA